MPRAAEPPYGAMIVVYRRTARQLEYLLLHRPQTGPVDREWAWGAPAGSRRPGEPVDDCAARELLEETGLGLPVRQSSAGETAWPAYLAEAPHDATVVLSHEHDHYRWVSLDEAIALITPAVVRASFAAVASTLPTASHRRG